MAEQHIRFDDGAAYERAMGSWRQLVGASFLDWLAPPAGSARPPARGVMLVRRPFTS